MRNRGRLLLYGSVNEHRVMQNASTHTGLHFVRLEKLNQGLNLLPPLLRLFGKGIEDNFPLRKYSAVSANHCLEYLLHKDVICVFDL